jgi:carboxylesterase
MSVHDAPTGSMQDYRHIGKGSNAKVGIIFVHGFTGSPISMRPWADFFSEKGFSVSVPLLPGHGTTPEDLNRVKWKEWPTKVEAELDWMIEQGIKPFIFGLSMGGGLILHLALSKSREIAGIVLVNPMIHIKFVPHQLAWAILHFQKMRDSVGDDIRKPGITEHGYDFLPVGGLYQLLKMLSYTRKRLHDVTTPLMLFHSKDDHTLPVTNTEMIMKNIGSVKKQRIELVNSFHVATLDFDQEIIFENSFIFVEAHKPQS